MSDVLFMSLKGKSSWVCPHQKFVCRRIYARMKESFSRFSSSSSSAAFFFFISLSYLSCSILEFGRAGSFGLVQ